VDPEAVVVGEVGLGGEIRTISQIEKRISEASKLGFKRIFLPRNNMKNLREGNGITLQGVETIEQAIDGLVGG
jgi:DNA repair protein RadA/Sms